MLSALFASRVIFLPASREISAAEEGELLAVMSAGAYAAVMGSNYNGRLRPAEVLVNGSEVKLVRKRETLEQLVQNELSCKRGCRMM